jgi:hypothetical protein
VSWHLALICLVMDYGITLTLILVSDSKTNA